MPTAPCAAAWACLKHSARAALDLLIGFVAVCAASDVARNGSKAIAKNVRVLSIFASVKRAVPQHGLGRAEAGWDPLNSLDAKAHAINGRHAKSTC